MARAARATATEMAAAAAKALAVAEEGTLAGMEAGREGAAGHSRCSRSQTRTSPQRRPSPRPGRLYRRLCRRCLGRRPAAVTTAVGRAAAAMGRAAVAMGAAAVTEAAPRGAARAEEPREVVTAAAMGWEH